jgi:hypothetical protein
MIFLASKLNRSFAYSVALNKRFAKCVSTVEFAWGSTSVKFASSMMMIRLKNSITATDVESAESVDVRISFTVTSVAVAIQSFSRTVTLVLKELCITTVPFVLSICSSHGTM